MSKVHQIKNQDYLQIWDDYVNDKTSTKMPARKPALLPLYVDIRRGGLYRDRITSKDVDKFYNKDGYKNDIPDYMRTQPDYFPNIDDVFDEYIKHFSGPDGGEAPDPLNPLDIMTNRPTYMLFTLPEHKNKNVTWRFTKEKEFSCINDGVGPFRNMLRICTLNDRKSLLMLNRHRSNPEGFKYNLHVTITQTVKFGGKKVEVNTPIIIDPGTGNEGHGIP
jgi:hypothetical protein